MMAEKKASKKQQAELHTKTQADEVARILSLTCDWMGVAVAPPELLQRMRAFLDRRGPASASEPEWIAKMRRTVAAYKY